MRLRIGAAAGDVLVLLLFAGLGKSAHHERAGLFGAAGVAAPFIAGWFSAALPLGAFRLPSLTAPGRAAHVAAPAWLTGGLIGLAVRSLVEGRAVPLTFAGVALGFNLVTLTGWRVLLAWIVSRRADPPDGSL